MVGSGNAADIKYSGFLKVYSTLAPGPKNGIKNFLGLQSTTIAGNKPIAAGRHAIRFDFAYDGGGPGKGGLGTLLSIT